MNLEVALGMSTYGANLRCFGTYYDMSAVTALPDFYFTLLKYFLCLNIL